jgi:hypothetical protein
MAATELRRELEAVRLLLASRLDAMSDTSDSRLTTLQEAIKTARYDRDRDINALREIIEARLNEAEKDTGRRIDAYSLLPGEIQGDRDRAIAALRELLESRLAAMDKATELLAATVGRVPSDTDKQVNALRELLGARIDGMDVATKLLATNVSGVAAEIEKSATSTKEIIETRLAGMDEATKLLATNVDKVPYAILQEAGNLKAFIMSRIDDVAHISDEKFAAIDGTFASNALALTAALAAQKEAAAEQNKSNTLAITKSEQATKETIIANAAQTQSGLTGLGSEGTARAAGSGRTRRGRGHHRGAQRRHLQPGGDVRPPECAAGEREHGDRRDRGTGSGHAGDPGGDRPLMAPRPRRRGPARLRGRAWPAVCAVLLLAAPVVTAVILAACSRRGASFAP